MRTAPLAFALAALTVFAGCDALGPEAAGPAASSKMRLWADAATASPGAVRANLSVTDSVDFIVTFVPGTDADEGSDEVFSEQDVRRRPYITESSPRMAATVSLSEFDALMMVLDASPIVLWVEPDVTLSAPIELGSTAPLSGSYTGQATDAGVAALNLPFSGQMLPWNVTLVGGDRSSARSGDGAGAVDLDVYVIDSGVNHPDVDIVEHVRFFDAALGDGSFTHGNHVAAIIAARDDASGVVGVAPGARIHSLDVFDAQGTASMSRLVAAVDYVTAAKLADPDRPMVVNMSVGSRTGTKELNALDEAVQASMAAGVVYVVAAGNQGVPADVVSPAHVPGVLTVGAYDANRVFAVDFSNHGAMVDILAPGVRVVSAADNGLYAMLDGTSMAAPHVAGAAALYLAAHPAATQDEVAAALIAGGRNNLTSRLGTTRRSVWLGGL